MAKFRMSDHCLMIEKGRHWKLPREERTCPFCPDKIEDEKHFLIECYGYNHEELTSNVIQIAPNFANLNPNAKFFFLMNQENSFITYKIAATLQKRFEERKDYLELLDWLKQFF